MNRKDRGILRPHQATISVLQKLLDLGVICIGMSLVIATDRVQWDYSAVIATLFALVIFYLLGDFGQLYVSWRGERTREERRAGRGRRAGPRRTWRARRSPGSGSPGGRRVRRRGGSSPGRRGSRRGGRTGWARDGRGTRTAVTPVRVWRLRVAERDSPHNLTM